MKKLELTIKDIIEVLTQFEIQHIELEDFIIGDKTKRLYGLTDNIHYSDGRGKIYLDISRKKSSQVRTILHELYHAYHLMKEIDHREKDAETYEKESYNKHFK